MRLDDIPLFAMLKGRMTYLSARQRVIAENVANADTPGFTPRDIKAPSFEQTLRAGGVTTSTVTVPMVAALGLGLAEQLPGRSPLADGFGLIASAALCPMLTVMGYAQLAEWRARRRRPAPSAEG